MQSMRLAAISAITAYLAMYSPAFAVPMRTPPLQLTASWIGAPCNSTGSLAVSLKNVSPGLLSTPKKAIIPILFTVEIYTPKFVYSSVGHPYIYSIYPPHYATRGGLKTLQPGQSIAYTLELVDAKNRGMFGDAWFAMLRKGGEVTVRYTLPHLFDAEGDPHVFFVDDNNMPYVHSNMLKCPGTRRR